MKALLSKLRNPRKFGDDVKNFDSVNVSVYACLYSVLVISKVRE